MLERAQKNSMVRKTIGYTMDKENLIRLLDDLYLELVGCDPDVLSHACAAVVDATKDLIVCDDFEIKIKGAFRVKSCLIEFVKTARARGGVFRQSCILYCVYAIQHIHEPNLVKNWPIDIDILDSIYNAIGLKMPISREEILNYQRLIKNNPTLNADQAELLEIIKQLTNESKKPISHVFITKNTGYSWPEYKAIRVVRSLARSGAIVPFDKLSSNVYGDDRVMINMSEHSGLIPVAYDVIYPVDKMTG